MSNQLFANPQPWAGGRVSPIAECVLADNPGPMTLDGTNTWIIGAPTSQRVVIVDPGPADGTHWRRVNDVLEASGRTVELILLTHRHLDHSAGAVLFTTRTGCEMWAQDPEQRIGGASLEDGQVISAAGLDIEVVNTPGHTSDSVCFLIASEGTLVTGDTILGRGTTVIAYPDGQLGPYLESLAKLANLCDRLELTTLLPGHGPVRSEPSELIADYRQHRAERIEQVAASLDRAGVSPEPTERVAQLVVEDVYADVPRSLWPAATASVLAQLEYLSSRVA